MDKKINNIQKFSRSYIFSLYLSLGMSRILGIAPFHLQISPNNNYNNKNKQVPLKFWYSYVGSVYNVFLIICLLVSISFTLPLLAANSKADAIFSFEAGLSLCSNFVSIIILLFYCIKQQKIIKLCNRIVDFENILAKELYNVGQLEEGKYYQIALIISHIIVTLLTCGLLVVVGHRIYIITEVLPEFYVAGVAIQYVTLLMFLKQRFYLLNQSLLVLTNSSSNLFTNTISVTFNDTILQKIYVLRKSQRFLYEITIDVSKFYSRPILFAIPIFGCELVYNSYYGISPFLASTSNTNTKYNLLLSMTFAIWVVTNIFPIVTLTSCVTNIIVEVGIFFFF